MSVKLITGEYKYFDIVYSDTNECPVDAEYYLPDYCPDIQKILKCTAVPQVDSYLLSGDKLSVMGSLTITLLYLDEKAVSIRSCEITKEFSSSVKITGATDNSIAHVNSVPGHIICRAVSARKLDIHIPILLEETVYSLKSDMVVTDADGIEKKTSAVKTSEAINCVSHDFTISRELELGAPPVESVLRRSAEFTQITAKTEQGKVIVSGFAEITVTYRGFSENSILEKMQYQIPISEVIECDEADDDCRCTVSIMTGEVSLQTKEDSMGENTLFSLYLKAFANLLIYKNTEFNIVTDGYCPGCMSRESYSRQCFMLYDGNDALHFDLQKSMPTEAAEKILDIWCSEPSVSAFSEIGKIIYRGKFTATVIYVNTEKRVCSCEKVFDYSYPVEYNDVIVRKAVSRIAVTVSDFKIVSEAEIDTKFSLSVKAFIMTKDFSDVLSGEELMDENKVDNSGRIIICYGNKNEGSSLWSVGKKYRMPISELCEINGIADENNFKYPLILYK